MTALKRIAEMVVEFKNLQNRFLKLRYECNHWDDSTFPQCRVHGTHCCIEHCPLEVRKAEFIGSTIYCPDLDEDVVVKAEDIKYVCGTHTHMFKCKCNHTHKIDV